MTTTSQILDKIRTLEAELAAQLALEQANLKFGIENGKIIFEAEMLRQHKAMQIKLWPYLRAAGLLTILTAPLIYGLTLPLVLLDIFVTIYQAVCFPVYGIAKVRRQDYLNFDRSHLAYLNALEKINCGYCAYGNGILGYAGEIAARTELYWCPIKHARRMQYMHSQYRNFVEFGDAEAFKQKSEKPDLPSDPPPDAR
ncbi:MAG: hypothetical protein KGQ46_10090 [Hyphomicrobiales bacterium]|nr:hypothetical protein [Hyphomicrobiales bacterium]MDE2114582.1 hypothetical protein [Hyphomicrobiales bacterium]